MTPDMEARITALEERVSKIEHDREVEVAIVGTPEYRRGLVEEHKRLFGTHKNVLRGLWAVLGAALSAIGTFMAVRLLGKNGRGE